MPRRHSHTTPVPTDLLQAMLVELSRLRAAVEKAGIPVAEPAPLELVHPLPTPGKRSPKKRVEPTEADYMAMVEASAEKMRNRKHLTSKGI